MKLPVAALLSGLLLGQSSITYVRTKTNDNAHCLHWAVNAGARRSLAFVQSTTGDPTLGAGSFDAVSRSGQTWESQLQACGSLDLVEGSRSSSRFVGYTSGGSNENLILFRSQLCSAVVPPGDSCLAAGTCGNAHDCWDHDASIVALTTTSYIVSTGELVDADVEVNAASQTPTIVDSPVCSPGAISTSCVANDVQNAMTHEFGHLLGLAHSPDPASTMYASEPLGETSKRVLDSGSKQFVCDVYPSGQASKDCTSSPSTSNGSSGCSSAGPIPWAPGLLLVLLALGRRRPAGTLPREA
ncbi:MAG TPA: myxosortase-dependent metalloprotease, MXAN_2677/MXAN_2678 family [Myxococcaceae bacterium]